MTIQIHELTQNQQTMFNNLVGCMKYDPQSLHDVLGQWENCTDEAYLPIFHAVDKDGKNLICHAQSIAEKGRRNLIGSEPTNTLETGKKQQIISVFQGNMNRAQSQPTTPSSTKTPTQPQQKQPINGAPQTVASNATPFEEIPTKSEINNNLQSEEQDSQTPTTEHNSKQEHFLGISTRGWIIISTCAIVGGAIGATLVATGIIPAIIGLIATAILAGATGVVTGGAIGAGMACLTKIVINKYCGEEAAAQPA